MTAKVDRRGPVSVDVTRPLEPATSVVDAVARLHRAVYLIGNLRLQPWNMTLSSYTALRVVATRPNLSLVQLARRCFVRPQTMTRIVSTLQQRGLVERLPNPDSERALSLVVTRDGRAALAEMSPEVDKINLAITRVLDDWPDRRARRHVAQLRFRGRS